jgi:hypothetical protein
MAATRISPRQRDSSPSSNQCFLPFCQSNPFTRFTADRLGLGRVGIGIVSHCLEIGESRCGWIADATIADAIFVIATTIAANPNSVTGTNVSRNVTATTVPQRRNRYYILLRGYWCNHWVLDKISKFRDLATGNTYYILLVEPLLSCCRHRTKSNVEYFHWSSGIAPIFVCSLIETKT